MISYYANCGSYHIFINNCFTSFRLLPHRGVNNIRATCESNKNRIPKCTIIVDKQPPKKECGHFQHRTLSKNKHSEFDSGTKTEPRTQLLLNPLNLRDLFGVRTKLKENLFKYNNQINSTVTTRTWLFSAEWTRTSPITGLVSK